LRSFESHSTFTAVEAFSKKGPVQVPVGRNLSAFSMVVAKQRIGWRVTELVLPRRDKTWKPLQADKEELLNNGFEAKKRHCQALNSVIRAMTVVDVDVQARNTTKGSAPTMISTLS
jgi:hypothetical protein